MKRYISLLLFAFVFLSINAQSTNRSSVKEKIYLNNTASASIDIINYYDGLGRAEQTVMIKVNPSGADLVDYIQYDRTGRDSVRWLPVTNSGNGAYVPLSNMKAIPMPAYSEGNPFDKTVYDVLDRPLTQTGPGIAWTAHPISNTYQLNATNEVKAFKIYGLSSDRIIFTEYYEPGTLFKKETKDEDGIQLWEYTDKDGRVIMVRNSTLNADTYYVYNETGKIRYVLPAAVADALSAFNLYDLSNDAIKNYAYYYRYDSRRNCITKKMPGCDSIIMKYDQSNRLIFSQDGNQRAKSEWTFFLYDALGRQAVSGICPAQTFATFENTVVKATYNGGTTLGGYVVTPGLTGTLKLMTVNYYDDYAFLNMSMTAIKDSLTFSNRGYDAQHTSAKGLPTGTRVYQLNDPAKYTVSAMYYDHAGRVVQNHASNHLEGYDNEYFIYKFSGKVAQRMAIHSATGITTKTEVYYYDYGDPLTNPTERLVKVEHKTSPNTAKTILASYKYDAINRVIIKKMNSSMDSLTYNYNIRNWVTRISGAKFNQTLTYNTAVNNVTPSTPTYNGNISAMKWKAGNETTERGYKFTYDGLNRLTTAYYGEGPSLTANPNHYNELVSYDKMGNIRTLQRQGKVDNNNFGLIDNLTYNSYNGNQITKITDAVTPGPLYAGAFHFMDGADVAVEYTYDANGNLKKDYNKKIVDIQYNSLNLPNGLQFTNGNTTNYVYDAAGQKLSVTHQTAVAGVIIPMTGVMTPLSPAQILQTFKTDYCGNVIYENGAVSRILTEEGYITFNGTTPVYHYYLKDHQGNNRVVLNQDGTVEQVNHYYPFGGLMGESTAGGVQPYKYNGKELDRMHGLDLFDYGARHYDAAIGRWSTIDPMAEVNYHISPYVYTSNNPINRIDATGMLDDWVEDEFKHVYWDENATSQATTKTGETYLGKTVYATNEDGSFRYGDQYGNWHDSAPLPEISVTGFHISGSGPVSSAMRQAAQGYDPQWMVGFNKFVEAGLTAINLTLTATTLAAEAGSFGGGSRIRAALNTVDDAAKGGLTNPQLVQKSATLAERAIGGQGPVAGIAKHKYATQLLDRYQSIYGHKGLFPNHSFNNGIGNRGILDVLDRTNGVIYDFKFGKAVMSPAQYNKYYNNFGLPIQIIRP